MNNDVYNRVAEVTADVLKCEPTAIRPDARFVEDLGAASIQSVELMAGFEDAFDVDIDEQEALRIKTVGAATDYIAGLLEA